MSIKVGVRVCRFNDREKKNKSVCIIEINSQNQTKMKKEMKKYLHLIILFGLIMGLKY